MTPHDRLRRAREEAGFPTARAAADRFGWQEVTYRQHENGNRGFNRHQAAAYAKAFKVTPEWLTFGRAALPVESSAEGGAADLVPIYSVHASAGYGAIVGDGDEEIVDRMAFPQGYLRSITKAALRDLAIISVKGDSMAPTLADNDVVMVDTSKRDLSFDGLFVLRDGGASLLVKRIGRASGRGRVLVISDNRSYPPMERAVDEIEVVGRVVWRGVRE